MKTNLALVFIMVFAIASHGQPPVALPVIPPMEAHWPLDDGKGSVVTEVIGGLNGTLKNADPAVAWTSGVLGGALHLDGIDDRVIVPHNPAFDFADEAFSVSFMMR